MEEDNCKLLKFVMTLQIKKSDKSETKMQLIKRRKVLEISIFVDIF